MLALVTGGNGHLGYGLVCALRARGYRVRASVRSLSDDRKLVPLRALDGVELVEADVRNAAQVRAACDGIDVLFHVAAVYSTTDRGREAEILPASLQGTEATLRAARDARVGKVVFTSSVVTLPLVRPGAPPSTEADWQTDFRVTYLRAKTEGERLAWRLAGELALNLVTVLPSGIIGPGFQRNTPTIDVIEGAARGMFRLGAPRGNFTFADVRDVAEAHVRAAERDAQGRLIVVDRQPSFRELVEALHEVDPRIGRPLLEVPPMLAPLIPAYDALCHRFLGTPRLVSAEGAATGLGGLVWNVSAARARAELGWEPAIPFEQSLRDTLAQLRSNAAARGRRGDGTLPKTSASPP